MENKTKCLAELSTYQASLNKTVVLALNFIEEQKESMSNELYTSFANTIANGFFFI
jgi:hypothetical protein